VGKLRLFVLGGISCTSSRPGRKHNSEIGIGGGYLIIGKYGVYSYTPYAGDRFWKANFAYNVQKATDKVPLRSSTFVPSVAKGSRCI
jgi:hypothetical protein